MTKIEDFRGEGWVDIPIFLDYSYDLQNLAGKIRVPYVYAKALAEGTMRIDTTKTVKNGEHELVSLAIIPNISVEVNDKD
jgi:hypothetical protein